MDCIMIPRHLLPMPKPGTTGAAGTTTGPLPYTDLELLTVIVLGFNESNGEIYTSPYHICKSLGTQPYPVRVKKFGEALKSLTEDTTLNEERQPVIQFPKITPPMRCSFDNWSKHRIQVTNFMDTIISNNAAGFVPPSSWAKSRIGSYYASLSREEFTQLRDYWLGQNKKGVTHLNSLALMVRAYLLIKSELPHSWVRKSDKAAVTTAVAPKSFKRYMGQIEQEYILKELRVTKPTWQKAVGFLTDSNMLLYQPGVKDKGCGCFFIGDISSDAAKKLWQAFCVRKGLWYE